MNTRNESYNPLLKSYVDSEKINAVTEGAENLYVRLIAQSDDEGRYSADPNWVLAKLYTHRMFKGLKVDDVAARIEELWSVDLIRLYEVEGKKFLQVVDVFRTHRKDVKKKLFYPEPLSEPVTYAGRARNEPVTDALRTRAEHVTLDQTRPAPDPDQTNTKTAPASPAEPTEAAGGESVSARKSASRFSADDFNYPASLDTPECRAAIESWLKHKRGKRQSYKSTVSLNLKLDDFARDGPEALIAAVRFSIGNDYDGLFPDKNFKNANRPAPTAQQYQPGKKLGPV